MNIKKSPFLSLGIKGDKEFRQIIYNNLTDDLIAQFVTSGTPMNSLYIRKSKEERYSSLFLSEEGYSYDNPTTSDNSAAIFININKWEKSGYSGDWEAILQFDLNNRERKEFLNKENIMQKLKLDTSFCRAWVSQILGINGNGKELFIIVALEEEINKGNKVLGSKMHYKLCRVNIESYNVKWIATLFAGMA